MERLAELERDIETIMAAAERHGLDFGRMRFEICPAEVLYCFSAYGMPRRFRHWSFGKAFQRLKMEYEHRLLRIYEMVINTDPCYAFLLAENNPLQNRLAVAHVLAHSDFFRNNVRFAPLPRDMLDTMAASARRLREYGRICGQRRVEEFLDAVLAVRELVDAGDDGPPTLPSRDLLGFVLHRGRGLAEWQRDIIAVVRSESLYFRPQLETRICNEGWATYWHRKIMRALDLTDEQAVEFARLQAELLRPARTHVNPYLLGLGIFTDIEKRYGKEMIFEVRAISDDISLLRNYLTADLAQELGLYVFRRVGYEWRVSGRDWRTVRDTLIQSLFNGGHPYIVVEDGDWNRRGELYLRHCYEGLELDVPYLEKTLALVYRLWGRTVHLETVLDDKVVVFSCDGDQVAKRVLGS